MSELLDALRALNVEMDSVSEEGCCMAFKTDGAKALELWRALRAGVDSTGHWPVLLGPQVEIDAEPASSREQTEPILKAAESISAATWFAARLNELGDADGPPGNWDVTDEPKAESFVIPNDILTGRPHPDLIVALVPTRAMHEVPAYLNYGGWNDCPNPEEHVALLKYWHERYGAEVVGMAHDIVECTVPRPPRTREAALVLAREQYAYCADIVWQGTESVDALAAMLLNAPQWYFWWD